MATACPRRPPVDVGAVCRYDARQEPGTVVPYAGICGGGGQQWPSLLRLRSEARAEQRLAPGGRSPHNPYQYLNYLFLATMKWEMPKRRSGEFSARCIVSRKRRP